MNIKIPFHDFPILKEKPAWIYLDSAATTQKPQCVIDRMVEFYAHEYANVHRGLYQKSYQATVAFEEARKSVQQFINAPAPECIIWTKGATESINLVASGFKEWLKPDDEILITEMEHHANIVPWQQVCLATGAKCIAIPFQVETSPLDVTSHAISDKVTLDINFLEHKLKHSHGKIKLIALTHVSNVLGVINPIKKITSLAHQFQIPVLVDGAQAVGHFKVDVQDLDCDFYVFSGHKMYGPTGIGILYGKREALKRLPLYQTGGEMIETVTLESSTFKDIPYCFEAGTPPIAEAIALKAAIDYLHSIGMPVIQKHEHKLLQLALKELAKVDGIRILNSQTRNRVGIISFELKGVDAIRTQNKVQEKVHNTKKSRIHSPPLSPIDINTSHPPIHPHDIACILDENGVAIRTGKLCAEPTLTHFGIEAICRISLGVYSRTDDIHQLVAALIKAKEIFHGHS